ncbi:MAG TPA: VC0807 family protein, partial [Ktedonobacteraceae bacterium]|nr:VC0807 family protein [Ktedonobacteraceae bacterium]
LAGLVLIGIATSLITIALGGSPKVYLIRESFFTAAFGLAYLVSLFFPRPLAFYFSRYFATGNHPENISWFDSLWQYPMFRHSMRVITVVWGIGFICEAVLRTYLVIVLSTEQFLIVSPFVLYGILAALIIWMFLYSRQGRKRSEEVRQRMAAEQHATPPPISHSADNQDGPPAA